MAFFDLASLAKPLVTAPLALTHLDLDLDRRAQLGFRERGEPLTVRQLLSHSAGLPAWLPYTGEPLAAQLRRGLPEGAHPLLRAGRSGVSTYSDLGYRLLAELLVLETGRGFSELGAEASGLSPCPWPEPPRAVPDGPDADAWPLAEPTIALPARAPGLPQDANARAGMPGHAGFGTGAAQAVQSVARWVEAGFPARMAVDTARSEDGQRWGLGLQRALDGPGRFARLLAAIPPEATGVHLVQATGTQASPPAPALDASVGAASPFWFHLGFPGPALFVRPETGLAIILLAHRLGPAGELLTAEGLRARRWQALHDAPIRRG